MVDFFSPNGRISRGTYWAVLAVFLTALVISARATGVPVLQAFDKPWATLGRAADATNVLAILPDSVALSVAITLLALAVSLTFLVSSNRLHDLGRSGWWALLLLVPGVNLLLMLTCAIVPGRPPAAA